jgi:pyridoxamine 5'-phosphate oxidase
MAGRRQELTKRLRELPVLTGSASSFDPDDAPEHPAKLFLTWLNEAIESGVREPHAMTLSTVDAAGRPDSRVLILKGLDDGRWTFATNRESRKGAEIAEVPWAAANFYWREVGRQVRIRGRVVDSGADASAQDFLERPPSSRAASLASRQSQPLTDPAELDVAFSDAAAAIESDPGLVPDHWALFQLAPDEVEFWQAEPDRPHLRLRYALNGAIWSRQRLWP